MMLFENEQLEKLYTRHLFLLVAFVDRCGFIFGHYRSQLATL